MTKHIYAALIGATILSSCSRPVAYFQRGPVENYHTPKTEVATIAATSTATPLVSAEAPSTPSTVVTPVVSPTEQVAQAKQTVNQIDAYVRNDSKLASNNKLTKRIERVKSLLNSAVTKTSSASTTNIASKKMSLLERVAVKKIDKRIKNKLAPDQTMAKSMFTIGIIVAAAGLVLLLIGNGFGAALGGIALVVGLVLIILDLVQS